MASLNSTLGATEVGVFLSCVLYGVATVQVYIYSANCKHDPLWLRLMVIWIWLLETTHEILLCVYLYDLSVSHFGQQDHIGALPVSFYLSIIISGLIGSCVQSFFAWRLFVLSRRWLLPVISWTGSALRMSLAVVISVYMAEAGTLDAFDSKHGWTVIFTIVVHASVDILNTSALLSTLSARKKGFKSTSRVIEKIMMYTVETGLVTSIFGCIMLITRLSLPQSAVWVGLLMVYAKLYSNSLMVSLNARLSLHQKMIGENAGIRSSGGLAMGPLDPSHAERAIDIQMVHLRNGDIEIRKERRISFETERSAYKPDT